MARKKKQSDRVSYWCVDQMAEKGVVLGFKCALCGHGWQEQTSVLGTEVDRKATPDVSCSDCGKTSTYSYLPSCRRWGR